jgi:hypothetical protein
MHRHELSAMAASSAGIRAWAMLKVIEISE